MKKEIWKHLLLIALFFAIFQFGSQQAAAASLGVIQHPRAGTTTWKRDITGDGKIDTIKMKLTGSGGYYKNFTIYINGKKALTENIKGCSDVIIRFFSCKKSANFLYVSTSKDGGYLYFSRIYAYSKGKLLKAADLLQEVDNAGDHIQKVTSNSINVRYSVQPLETGFISWNYTFQRVGKKFKLKSTAAKVTSNLANRSLYRDNYQKYFDKNQFVVQRQKAFYTGTNLNKVAFTAKKGDVLTLSKLKAVNKKLYLGFKKKGKLGWIKVGRPYSPSSHLFYGVSKRMVG